MADNSVNGRDPLGHIPPLGAPGAMDLSRPVPDTSEEGVAWGEVKVGLRCAGCGERITRGFEFIRVQVVKHPRTGERSALRSTQVSCARIECDYAFTCGQLATAVRKIDNEWLFMDDDRMKAMFNPEAN